MTVSTDTPVSKPTKYCRKCDYILDGLPEPRCPECGRPFDPARRRTFRIRPRRRWWLTLILRAGASIVVVCLISAVGVGWLWWTYTVEHRTIAGLEPNLSQYGIKRIGPDWLNDWTARHDIRVLERVNSIEFTATATDGDLRQVRKLGSVEEVRVDGMITRCVPGPVLLCRLPAAHSLITEAGFDIIGNLRSLRKLCLCNMNITGSELAQLAGLTRLECLDLSGTRIEGEWLDHIKGLTALRRLYLCASHITDRGLASVGELTNLEALYLNGAGITDEGLNRLAVLPKLQILDLSGTQITLQRADVFQHLRLLSFLELRGTPVTDTSLSRLQAIEGLTFLGLGQTGITDEGLVHLRGVAKLSALDLSDTRVTDAGLTHLQQIQSLQVVWLERTQVSRGAVDRLKASVRDIIVSSDFDPVESTIYP